MTIEEWKSNRPIKLSYVTLLEAAEGIRKDLIQEMTNDKPFRGISEEMELLGVTYYYFVDMLKTCFDTKMKHYEVEACAWVLDGFVNLFYQVPSDSWQEVGLSPDFKLCVYILYQYRNGGIPRNEEGALILKSIFNPSRVRLAVTESDADELFRTKIKLSASAIRFERDIKRYASNVVQDNSSNSRRPEAWVLQEEERRRQAAETQTSEVSQRQAEKKSSKPKPLKAVVIQEPIEFEPAPDRLPAIAVVPDTVKWIEAHTPFRDFLSKQPQFQQLLTVKGICKEIVRCNGYIPKHEEIGKLYGSHVFTLYMCVPVLYCTAKYDSLFRSNLKEDPELLSKYGVFYVTMAQDIVKVMQFSKLRDCNSTRPDYLRRSESRLLSFPDQCRELETLVFRMRDDTDVHVTFESVGDYFSSLSELYS